VYIKLKNNTNQNFTIETSHTEMFEILCFAFAFHIVKLPFDRGANKRGARFAPDILSERLYPEKIHSINFTNPINYREPFGKGFMTIWKLLNAGSFTLVLGGDHTVAISSVSAAHDFCKSKNQRLGVLWCDAHADFNTLLTSQTKNIHGIPVGILCGHTLKNLMFGQPLEPNQFAYYGVRDLDSLEFTRFQEYDMKIIDFPKDLCEWMENFDKIHISFDVDCLDPSVASGVNTPVPNGVTLSQLNEIFDNVKKSKKLISMDVVEYNPTIEDNTDIIIDIINKVIN